MKTWFRKKIRNKLNHYLIPLNNPDTSLPQQLNQKKSVAVIGAGIAGMSASANLAERGFEVTLFEKANFLSGKMGSWKFESNGENLQVEHGFHALIR